MIVRLVGLEKLTNGFGLICMVRGITAIIGPPLEGSNIANFFYLCKLLVSCFRTVRISLPMLIKRAASKIISNKIFTLLLSFYTICTSPENKYISYKLLVFQNLGFKKFNGV